MNIELMRASDLISGLPVEGLDQDFEVTGVTHDSRRVEEGDLYVALVGEVADGRVFASQARDRGAVAVLAAGDPPANYVGPWLTAGQPREVLATLAARLAGHPDRELMLVGVTGTNGKSTVTALVASMLEAAGRTVGSVGTLGYHLGEIEITGGRTTPEASDLFPMLRQFRDAGGEAVAMEVSSHALALERASELRFDAAVFTNLSRDHFDFHQGFDDYFETKKKLFGQLKSGGVAVVNLDDRYGRRLAQQLESVVTFGGSADADVSVSRSDLSLEGIEAEIATPHGPISLNSPLLGRFNLSNLLAAVAVGHALGLEPEEVRTGLERVKPLAGRLEPIVAGQSFPVLIDYAHTDAALAASLGSLREIAGNRKIICVFGCGGDRDPGKRALMGRVAGELSDLPIVTSDNPRTEDPLEIIAAVERGLTLSGNEDYRVVPDRREAIRRAIAYADSGWLVLVAGKGHEEEQIVGSEVLPFSDRAEILAALETLGG